MVSSPRRARNKPGASTYVSKTPASPVSLEYSRRPSGVMNITRMPGSSWTRESMRSKKYRVAPQLVFRAGDLFQQAGVSDQLTGQLRQEHPRLDHVNQGNAHQRDHHQQGQDMAQDQAEAQGVELHDLRLPACSQRRARSGSAPGWLGSAFQFLSQPADVHIHHLRLPGKLRAPHASPAGHRPKTPCPAPAPGRAAGRTRAARDPLRALPG